MNPARRTFVVVILSAVLAISGSEIYAPSLPHLVQEFHTSINLVQWSMALYMIGISLTQLVYGPLSDRWGRRKPMIFGMILFIGGAVLGFSAQTIEGLLIARLIQGIGAGGPTGVWRSTFRDVYHGPELAQNASYVTLAISAILPIAPALGGMLENWFGWQGSFSFMIFYGLFVLIFLVFFFGETNHSLNRSPLTIPTVLKTYWELAHHRVFLGGSIVTSIIFGIKFSAAVVTPVFFIKNLGFDSATFGWVTALSVAVSYILSGWYNTRMVKKLGVSFMLRLGMISVLISGVLLGGSYLLVGIKSSLLIVSLLFLYFGGALVFPNAFATAFTPLQKNMGYASAFYGFFQTGGGAIVSSLMACLPDETPLPFSCMIILFSFLALWVHKSLVLKSSQGVP